ncbi:hypothetical protein C1645_826773 [Glomus cerebriforme]|uniref:Uncharacterized protein n=1 Tax=Glomus cerebriforme TaxID=658196 RepID=A0A397SWJ0_9GLOM|nr:hypothetical protein C1645_826773 [Glomus cerebriforme]
MHNKRLTVSAIWSTGSIQIINDVLGEKFNHNNNKLAIKDSNKYKTISAELDKNKKKLAVEKAQVSAHQIKVIAETFERYKSIKIDLITHKGVYPYEYIDSHDKKIELLPIHEFHSILEGKITQADYEHAQKVWKEFGCRNLVLSWDIMLKMTGANIELFTDMAMHDFTKKTEEITMVGISQYLPIERYKWEVPAAFSDSSTGAGDDQITKAKNCALFTKVDALEKKIEDYSSRLKTLEDDIDEAVDKDTAADIINEMVLVADNPCKCRKRRRSRQMFLVRSRGQQVG